MKRLKRFTPYVINRHRDCLYDLVLKRFSERLKSVAIARPVQRRYVERVRRFVEEEDGLVAEPETLKKFVEEVESSFFRYAHAAPLLFAPINELFEKIFDYEYFRDLSHARDDKWGGVPLMREILSRVRYCPYCNAETVYAIERKEKPKEPIKSAFDHFFPKERYPFLALSLYNLIPACFRCNSQYKRNEFKRVLTMPHPYIDDVDDLARFVPLGIQDTWFSGEASESLQLAFRAKQTKDAQRISDYDNVFSISNVYTQLFKQEAADAVMKVKMFTPAYVSQLVGLFKDAGLGHVNVKRLLFGTSLNREDINKERLSKLVMDMKEAVS